MTSPPGFTAPPAPQVKTQPLRPPPPELKLEEKKESASGILFGYEKPRTNLRSSMQNHPLGLALFYKKMMVTK